MEAYTGFAQVYDTFMDNVPYEEWADYYKEILREHWIMDGIVLDLGCGTGSMTELLAEQGYDMIGVDNSEEMLAEAMEKRVESGQDILYLLQDMQEFELYGTVDIILSLCDSMNYITDKEDMLKVFKLANNYLDPHGLFIFDLNTEYKFKNVLSDNTFAETTDDAAYIWENTYDEDEKINEYYVNFFINDENTDMYERVEECHYERAYSLDEIKELIKESGMKFVAAYDAFTFDEPKENSERIYVIAEETGK